MKTTPVTIKDRPAPSSLIAIAFAHPSSTSLCCRVSKIGDLSLCSEGALSAECSEVITAATSPLFRSGSSACS